MNVRLETEFSFLANVFFDNKVHSNRYRVKLELTTNTMDGYEQNIALDRVRHMLYKVFYSCCFMHENDIAVSRSMKEIGLHPVLLPDVPVDQIVGLMLFTKLTSVMEERLLLTQLSICSELGNNMWYLQDIEEDIGPFEEKGWWHDSSESISNAESNIGSGNVISLNSIKRGWEQHNLSWDTEIELSND